MRFFRSINDTQKKDWLRDYLDRGILPSNNGYSGIDALKNSDILTAVSIIAGDVARFPIIQIDTKSGQIINDDNLDYLLNKKINSHMSAYTWKFVMMVNTILTGNSYTRIIRDPTTYGKNAGKPIELEFFLPSQVSINYVDESDGRRYYYTFNPDDGRDSFDIESEDVIHFKFFTADGIQGRSPLLSLGNELGLQDYGISTLQKFFRYGFKRSILKAKKGRLSSEGRKSIVKDFENAQNSDGPIIIDETMDYQPLEIDTNVLNLINSNNWTTSQIAKALRIPAYKLSINSPNQSVAQLTASYINNDLPFYFQPIISEFQMKLFLDNERRKKSFDFDTRKDTARPVQELLSLEEHNVLTPNEILSQLGLNPNTSNKDLDRYQSTLNTVFLDKKEKYQEQNKTKPKGGETDGKKNSTS